ncbi:metal-dependent transcriptional regulator [Weissella viridescens]|uniref:Metal-dependent transcriptional regulator n=1 Tax=Weissella viridescens TaxID=1629 RepID=A0A3P2RAR8_WEIVI|nr:metal-dependent transcriptional regulator [Weissella viridescens]RRG17857.1 metal-dependent transcriptional regulator [Weissella viridescens]
MSDSVSKTQYLQTILELSGGDESTKISNNQIADHLHVTPSSVSNMLTKLQETGEVNVVPYYGVTLTKTGRETAIRLIRSHRLFETFIAEDLDLPVSVAHDNADHLDHDATGQLMDALDSFLKHPKYSPQGLPIPDAEYHYSPEKLTSLYDAKDGETITIHAFTEDLELLRYVETIGLPLNSTWTIKERLPFDGPLILNNAERELQITRHAAEFIYIEQ